MVSGNVVEEQGNCVFQAPYIGIFEKNNLLNLNLYQSNETEIQNITYVKCSDNAEYSIQPFSNLGLNYDSTGKMFYSDSCTSIVFDSASISID